MHNRSVCKYNIMHAMGMGGCGGVVYTNKRAGITHLHPLDTPRGPVLSSSPMLSGIRKFGGGCNALGLFILYCKRKSMAYV